MINDDISLKTIIFSTCISYRSVDFGIPVYPVYEEVHMTYVDALLNIICVRTVHGFHIRTVLTNDDSSCIRSNILENTFASNQMSLIDCNTETYYCHNLGTTLVKLISVSPHSTVVLNFFFSMAVSAPPLPTPFYPRSKRFTINLVCNH
jgi:hypothetical protein